MKWETNSSPSPKSRGQCLWQNSSLGAESRGCKGCKPLMVSTTLSDYWRTKQEFGAVSYGLSTVWPCCMCTNSQEHASCQSYMCPCSCTSKRVQSRSLYHHPKSPHCCWLNSFQQMGTSGDPQVCATSGAQGMAVWQDTFTEKETTLKSSLGY